MLTDWAIKKLIKGSESWGVSSLEFDYENYENSLVAFIWYYIETVSGFFLEMALWINYSTMDFAQAMSVAFDSDKRIKFCD